MRLRRLIPLGLLVSSGIDECDDLMLGLGLGVCICVNGVWIWGDMGGVLLAFSLFIFSFLFCSYFLFF